MTMKQNNETHQIITQAIDAIALHFPPGSDNMLMTDILVQANSETGMLTVSDDDGQEIFSSVVPSWVDNDSETFYDEVAQTWRKAISEHREAMGSLSIIKPYSFLLVDDDRETISELYLADDEQLSVDAGELMENLDDDLDAFLDKLLKS